MKPIIALAILIAVTAATMLLTSCATTTNADGTTTKTIDPNAAALAFQAAELALEQYDKHHKIRPDK